jgi:hypothetical protein
MRRLFFVLALGYLGSAFAVCGPITYNFQSISYPGDTYTELLGINAAGAVSGFHGQSSNSGFTLILPASYTSENFPASLGTLVTGINNLGNTSGTYVDGGGTTHGFLDTGGTFVTVDNPIASYNELLGLNNSGQYAGYYMSSGHTTGYTYNSSAMTYTALPSLFPVGTTDTVATGINDLGEVSGYYTNASVTSGFLQNGATLSILVFPGATFTEALGLNGAGDVVGTYTDTLGNVHGFLYDGSNYYTIDVPGAHKTFVQGVNASGVIVGYYLSSQGVTAGFVGTPSGVPEPGTLALTGIALAVFGLRKNFRR